MAKKPTARVEFVFFNVTYEDGSQRSNRKVPADVLDAYDKEARHPRGDRGAGQGDLREVRPAAAGDQVDLAREIASQASYPK